MLLLASRVEVFSSFSPTLSVVWSIPVGSETLPSKKVIDDFGGAVYRRALFGWWAIDAPSPACVDIREGARLRQ